MDNKDLLYSTLNSAQCYVSAWKGGKFGGEWMHVYVWLSPFTATWFYHNNVNWLYPNAKLKVQKIKKKKDYPENKFCCCLVSKSCLTLLWPHGLQPAWLLSPWNSPGKNTGIGCHLLLQETFPTQESDPRLSLLHCRQIRYHWSIK